MPTHRQSGFTLQEMMLGLLCASMLALTMGVLLFYNYQGLAHLQSMATMQRDAALALHTMNDVIRCGSTSNMSWVGANSYLVVNNTNHVEGWRFSLTNNRLMCAVSGGPSMALVQTGVTGFVCSLTPSNVVVRLNLTESALNSSMYLTNTIYPRN